MKLSRRTLLARLLAFFAAAPVAKLAGDSTPEPLVCITAKHPAQQCHADELAHILNTNHREQLLAWIKKWEREVWLAPNVVQGARLLELDWDQFTEAKEPVDA